MPRNKFKDLKILVADDNEATASRVRKILLNDGYTQVTSLSKFSSMEQLTDYHIVILDICWPKEESVPYGETTPYFGFDGLRYLRNHCPDTIVILMSANLFDMENLKRILEADMFFKSESTGTDILNLLSLAIKSRLNVEEDLGVATDEESGLLQHIKLLDDVLSDGRNDLFGLEKDSYDKLVCNVKEMKSILLKKKVETTPKKWRAIMKESTSLAKGCNRLLELIENIMDFL